MKAAQIDNYGDASAITIRDIPTPTISAKQVLVAVQAGSLNPFDTKIRNGALKDIIPLQLPITLGGDIAGTITEVGSAVQNLKAGDHVYGQANAVAGNSGAFAEFAAVQASGIAPAPSNLDLTQAAALPLVGVSALQALTEHLSVQAGQKVFIHGGAGGIGTIAIQIAKHLGAYVATTATAAGLDLVTQLGADQVIDYKQQDFSHTLTNFDAVFDTVGGAETAKALYILKTGGKLVSMTTPVDEAAAASKNLTTLVQSTHITSERLQTLRQLVEDGIVTPHISNVMPFTDIQKAFELRESGGVNGKIVLQIAEHSL